MRAAELCRRALPGSREWHKHAACCNTADSGRPVRLRRRLGHERCNKRDPGAGSQHNSLWIQYHGRCPWIAVVLALLRREEKCGRPLAVVGATHICVVCRRRNNFRYAATCNLLANLRVYPATCNMRDSRTAGRCIVGCRLASLASNGAGCYGCGRFSPP